MIGVARVWAVAAWECRIGKRSGAGMNRGSGMRQIHFLSVALLLLAAACTNNVDTASFSGPSCQGSSLVCHNSHKGGGHGGKHS
jgi:hypothetical protein